MIGVVIGRFQTHELHNGHLALLAHVERTHPEGVLVLLGVSAPPNDSADPLEYRLRERVIRKVLPTCVIAPVRDMRDDGPWAKQVDEIIQTTYGIGTRAVLYGGRKSFAPHYNGVHRVEQVNFGHDDESSSAMRERIRQAPIDSPLFLAGIIYSQQRQLPVTYNACDFALVRPTEQACRTQVLMGLRAHEGLYRFPGGHNTSDPSDEACARRELLEETGMTAEGKLDYVGSYVIDDWRTRGRADRRYVSRFFTASYFAGKPEAGDDIDEVSWVGMLEENLWRIVPEHRPLFLALPAHYERLTQDLAAKPLPCVC